MSVIMHDVARTKIVHPIFAPGAQGLAMLKRVLQRCADLGAVKEAGYIQVCLVGDDGGGEAVSDAQDIIPGVSCRTTFFDCSAVFGMGVTERSLLRMPRKDRVREAELGEYDGRDRSPRVFFCPRAEDLLPPVRAEEL